MGFDAFHQDARAAHVMQVVHLSFQRVQLLAHGLQLIPGVGLGGLHLPQLHVVLLHLLFQAQAAAAAAAAHAAAQRQGCAGQGQNIQGTECAHISSSSSKTLGLWRAAAVRFRTAPRPELFCDR